MKILCTICARGNSKGVPGKNIIDVGGLPLIAHSILQARQTGLFEHIAVSSDSQDILNVAERYGATNLIHRPDDLATSTSAKIPAIRHCASAAEEQIGEKADVIVDLDATSPLRLAADITNCVALLHSASPSNIITGFKSRRSPYFNMVESREDGCVHLVRRPAVPVVRRQDAPQTWDMNASIYVWPRQNLFRFDGVILERTMVYEMPEERSIDIDSPLDLEFVRLLMAKNQDAYRYDD